ncbi:MAG TPA: hypothetical protein ENN41_05355 [Sediminispirochaeta sp.]|nr:hypothetical protein [Sediminispirochaeta sp.]
MTAIFVSLGTSLITAGILYLILNKKIERKQSTEQLLESVSSEIDKLIVDLNRTADRNIALIEDRVKSLNQLIQGADRRLALLRKEIDKHTASRGTYSDLRQRVRKTPAPTEPIPNGAEKKVTPPMSSSSEGESEEAPKKSKREQILDMHRQGISADIIASRLDTTVAEIELIISMSEEGR